MPETDLECGDVVRDREDPEGRAVVINVPAAPAHEWHVPGGGTVATANPTYPGDAPVVVVVWASDLAASPYADYAGVGALPLAELHQRDVQYYAFPAPRLERVGQRGPQPIALDRLQPSPYHARTFDAGRNADYIAEIREQGPPMAPFVRAHPDGSRELLNGHKRVWACAAAGRDTIDCRTLWHVDEGTAARIFVDRHLEGYDEAQRERVLRRLRDRLGARRAADIVEGVTREDLVALGAPSGDQRREVQP